MTAMEELFANVIQHGSALPGKALPPGTLTIGFAVQASADKLTIQYQDDGPAFNPFEGLDATASHIHLGVEDRPVGGLGRLLVSRLADTAHYSRDLALNCIALEFARRAGF